MTDTIVNSLVINNLTKTQFDNVQSPSPTEIWAVDPEFTGGKLLQTNANGDIEESTLSPSDVQAALTNTTVTLTSAGWVGGSQTVTVSGMTSSKFVWVSPDASDASAYASAGILCTAQGTDSLTFTCSSAPSGDIDVVVVFG